MTSRPLVGLLGGTFDPIHLGHLAAARAVAAALDLDELRFVLSARPPHRPDSPRASGYHRIEMIRLAAAETMAAGTRVEVSDLELQRPGPSYTFDTLQRLHADGLTPVQLVFITGADAFAEIATWSRYPAVLDAAHFAVIARPGTTLDALRARLPALAARMVTAREFARVTTPAIVLIDSPTPDVSSTDIRRRAQAGESLDGLVPRSVAAYIAQHSLYRDAPDAITAPDGPGHRTAPVAPDAPDAPDAPVLKR
jgi:nicotinate-nucleotide adenylyltransferase